MPFSSAYTIDEADKEIKEKRTLILNDVMKWHEPINIKQQNPIAGMGRGDEENQTICRLPHQSSYGGEQNSYLFWPLKVVA